MKSRFILTMICLYIFITRAASACSGDPIYPGTGTENDPYQLPLLTDEIKIDGSLDEAAWQHALILDLPYETEPAENIPAPVKTDAFLFYTKTHFYIGFRAQDPRPKEIRARYTDRDQIWNDDYVMIFIDTFNDERRSFAIRSNPLGVQADDIRLHNSESVSWDAIYESMGQITDEGYIVEMAIPFNQLRFQRSREDQVWGFNVMRSYPRNVLHRMDAIPIDRSNDSILSQFIKMKGFEGAKPGKNIEIVPSLVGAQTDHRPDFPDGKMEKQTDDIEFGLSTRWGFTSNLTLNGTVNPDFSQVEADAFQLDINEPFSLWFPEKRPFFQEGADYFNTLKSAVYTRVMRNPLWGIKLSGKEGGNTVGAYVVQDDITNLIFPGNQGSSSTSLDQKNTSTVLRYKRDFGRSVTFGIMGTDREGEDYYNRLLAVDGDLRITNSDRIRFQALGSSTKYPDAVADANAQNRGNFNDYFIAVEFDHNARNLGYWLDFDDVGSGFRADLGFIPMVGFRNVEGGVNYTFYNKPGSWWTAFYISSELGYYEDRERHPLRRSAEIMLNYAGILQSHAHIAAYLNEEAYQGQTFDQTYFSSCFGFWPTRNLRFHTHFLWGDQIDYTNVRPGKRFRIDPELDLSIGRHLNIGFGHVYENMDVNGKRLYTANISYLSTIFHFNIRTFFRAILQYVDYDYNVQNYLLPVDSEEKQLFSQLLFSYKINPFTVFFLGYSDNYYGGHTFDLTRQNRTFFAKLSYAWVL